MRRQLYALAPSRAARNASADRGPIIDGVQAPEASGKPGPAGFTTVAEVLGTPQTIAPTQNAGVSATCPAGTTLISGGYRIVGFGALSTPPWITSSSRQGGANTWQVIVYNTLPGAYQVTILAVAYCAS